MQMVVSAEGLVMVMAHSWDMSSPGKSRMIAEMKERSIRLAMVWFNVGIASRFDIPSPVVDASFRY